MHLAVKLNRDEEEIATWPLQRLTRWMAFFKVVQEEEDRAIEEAKRKSRRKG